MPLTDYLPVIDDRRFDDLVAEARTRIPRYTREWTDFNDSDAGFALVQLFAWIGDQLGGGGEPVFRGTRGPDGVHVQSAQFCLRTAI